MRSALLDEGLERAGAAALLVVSESSRDPDLAAFAGAAHLGQSFVLAVRQRAPVLGYLVDMERAEAASTGLELAPSAEAAIRLRGEGRSEAEIWIEVLSTALAQAGLADCTVALAGCPPAGRSHLVVEALERRGFQFTSGHSLLRRYRKPKSTREIEAIRHAAAGTCLAFRRVAKVLSEAETRASALWRGGEPLTAGSLRREIALIFAASGLDQPEGNIVSTGADAGVPHTRGADSKPIRPSESIIVDLYPRGELFADCTRTFCVGEPSAKLETAHSLCRKALDQARAAAVPGVAGIELHEAVCRLFEAAGFATSSSLPGTRSGYVHGLGHGVGYELHELPSFRATADGTGTLERGDVFTLEPGLYAPEEAYGVRLEDLLLMNEDGAENLTPLPWDLDPRAW